MALFRFALAMFLSAAIAPGCASLGRGGSNPVSWSLSQTSDPAGGGHTVCQTGDPKPCVLDRSLPDKPNYASFELRVYGSSKTAFKGRLLADYLNDPDPRKYAADVDLTSNGTGVRHSLFARVTTEASPHSVHVHLEEIAADASQALVHDFTVPVTVR